MITHKQLANNCNECKQALDYLTANNPPKCAVQKITGQIVTDQELEEYTNVMVNWMEHWNKQHST